MPVAPTWVRDLAFPEPPVRVPGAMAERPPPRFGWPRIGRHPRGMTTSELTLTIDDLERVEATLAVLEPVRAQDADELRVWAEARDRHLATITDGETVLGVAQTRLVDPALEQQLVEESDAAGVAFDTSLVSAYLATIAVDPQAQGRGLGGKLVEDSLAWAREIGADQLAVVSWVHPGEELGRTSRRLLSDRGFETAALLSRPWPDGSCAICGDGCTCAGLLMVAELR